MRVASLMGINPNLIIAFVFFLAWRIGGDWRRAVRDQIYCLAEMAA